MVVVLVGLPVSGAAVVSCFFVWARPCGTVVGMDCCLVRCAPRCVGGGDGLVFISMLRRLRRGRDGLVFVSVLRQLRRGRDGLVFVSLLRQVRRGGDGFDACVGAPPVASVEGRDGGMCVCFVAWMREERSEVVVWGVISGVR